MGAENAQTLFERGCAKMRVWTWPNNPDYSLVKSQLETFSMKEFQCHIFHPVFSRAETYDKHILMLFSRWRKMMKYNGRKYFAWFLCVYHPQQSKNCHGNCNKFFPKIYQSVLKRMRIIFLCRIQGEFLPLFFIIILSRSQNVPFEWLFILRFVIYQ